MQAEPAFQKGWFEVQDEGSQIVAALAGAEPGMQVLDYCAGAGGKTLALSAAMENRGQIFAYDSEKARLAPIFDRMRRSGQPQRPGRRQAAANWRRSRARWTSCWSTRLAPAAAPGAGGPMPNGG